MKSLIIRPRFLNLPGGPTQVGIDVGWQLTDKDGVLCERWWGNTRDEVSLKELIQSLRAEGEVFEFPGETP